MSVATTTTDTLPLETKFSDMSLKNNNDNNNDQPLRRSTYNIFDASYDINIPQNAPNLLMDPYSIHPLEKVSDGYCMDLAPSQSGKRELTTMMEDLGLSPNASNRQQTISMPYCV